MLRKKRKEEVSSTKVILLDELLANVDDRIEGRFVAGNVLLECAVLGDEQVDGGEFVANVARRQALLLLLDPIRNKFSCSPRASQHVDLGCGMRDLHFDTLDVRLDLSELVINLLKVGFKRHDSTGSDELPTQPVHMHTRHWRRKEPVLRINAQTGMASA